ARTPEGFRWVPRAVAVGLDPDLDTWLTHLDQPRAPWFEPGWCERAEPFIRHELAQRGLQVSGRVAQIKHWSMSAVLRARAEDGNDYYLKSVIAQLAQEPVL